MQGQCRAERDRSRLYSFFWASIKKEALGDRHRELHSLPRPGSLGPAGSLAAAPVVHEGGAIGTQGRREEARELLAEHLDAGDQARIDVLETE